PMLSAQRLGFRGSGARSRRTSHTGLAMSGKQRSYRSYLLRLWLTGSPGTRVWRASLEDVATHERQNFASLEQLFAFVESQARRQPRDGDAPRAAEADGEPGDEGW